MTAAEEASIERWMGSVNAKLERLITDTAAERRGAAVYRREMRERMARVEQDVVLLDRDVQALKGLAPAVDGLEDGETRKNAQAALLVPLAMVAGTVLATVLAQLIMKHMGLI